MRSTFNLMEFIIGKNIRTYAAACEEADYKGGIHHQTQHPIQVMV